jgi:hypothetical protein
MNSTDVMRHAHDNMRIRTKMATVPGPTQTRCRPCHVPDSVDIVRLLYEFLILESLMPAKKLTTTPTRAKAAMKIAAKSKAKAMKTVGKSKAAAKKTGAVKKR